jgi:hypothetical protein
MTRVTGGFSCFVKSCNFSVVPAVITEAHTYLLLPLEYTIIIIESNKNNLTSLDWTKEDTSGKHPQR